jgi:hypothetical protein
MNYLRHSALRTIRGGIRFGRDLRRPLLPKQRELGYHRIAISCGFIANLPVFAVPNMIMLSVKTDTRLTCLISRIMGRCD